MIVFFYRFSMRFNPLLERAKHQNWSASLAINRFVYRDATQKVSLDNTMALRSNRRTLAETISLTPQDIITNRFGVTSEFILPGQYSDTPVFSH